jgi:hypothetical protein
MQTSHDPPLSTEQSPARWPSTPEDQPGQRLNYLHMPLRELRELAKGLDAKMLLTAGVESAETVDHVRARRYERELIQQILAYRQSPPSPWVAETVLPHV